MNYLAHLYLSFGHEEIMVGNYIADAVKGKQIEKFTEKVQEGIRLHRDIDTFTDTHPIVENSKARIRHRYRKYAGVVIDMYYDHFLAAGWENWSEDSLFNFTRHSYKTLLKNYVVMPARMKRILPIMAAGNWLASYAEVGSISLALKGMSRRTKFDSGIENGGEDLKLHYKELQNDFSEFFPELIVFSKKKTKL
jgi:acyl carrier protein phosphodiesterase